MKKFIALLLTAVMCAALLTVNVGAVPADEPPNMDIYTHDILFLDQFHYGDPVVYFQTDPTDDPDVWQCVPMTYGCEDEVEEESVYYMDFPTPTENYRFYIADTDTDRRTEVISVEKYRNLWLFPIWSDDDINRLEVTYRDDDRDRYLDRYLAYIQSLDPAADKGTYDEHYYHQDASGDTDWVLIYAYNAWREFAPVACMVDRHVLMWDRIFPFNSPFGLYDVKNDTFYDLTTMRDYDRYDGLREAIDRYVAGRVVGDMDNDRELTALDATIMQRCLAGIREFPADDEMMYKSTPITECRKNDPDFDEKFFVGCEPFTYYSDFNMDDERDMIDVTLLQRYLVGM